MNTNRTRPQKHPPRCRDLVVTLAAALIGGVCKQRRRASLVASGLAARFVTAAKATLLVAALVCAPAVSAQPHEMREGSYTVRSSVVRSEAVSQATAAAHGIEPASDRAVLNVVVMHEQGDRRVNVRARVTARALDLNGRPRTISLRPVLENDMVSYLGTFAFLPREVLDFEVIAVPAPDAPPLVLKFRDRMWFY